MTPGEPDHARTSGAVERRAIASRAGIVALGTLVSRLLGLVRDIVLAALFSRTATDAWMIAFQIPNLLRQLFAEGAVQAAVLPVLSKVREEQGQERAREFFRALRGLSLLCLIVVSLLGVLFAEPLVTLFASGFRSRPDQFELTTQLTRLSFPYILLMGTAALGVAALNAHRRFVVTSFAPGLLNVALITSALALSGVLVARGYDPIFSMALGALVGGVLQVVAQWPSLRKIGYASLPGFALSKDPHVREVVRRMGPTLLGVGVYYVDVIVGRRLLSELDQGAVTYFGYALRLCDFSQGIFIMALSSAALPSLSSFAARGQLDEVAETFAYAMRHALFVGICATGLFVVLAEPIVQVLLQRGQFTAHAAAETSKALVAQGLGIFLVAGVRQLVLVYFAMGDTKTPVYVAIVDVCVFATSSLLLRQHWGHVGVSLGVTVARVGQFGLLFWLLRKHLPSRHSRVLLTSSGRTSLATALAALVVVAMFELSPLRSWGRASALGSLLVGTSVFGATFLLAARLLRSDELQTLLGPLRRRLARLFPRSR